MTPAFLSEGLQQVLFGCLHSDYKMRPSAQDCMYLLATSEAGVYVGVRWVCSGCVVGVWWVCGGYGGYIPVKQDVYGYGGVWMWRCVDVDVCEWVVCEL